MQIVIQGAPGLGAAHGLRDTAPGGLLSLVRSEGLTTGHLLFLAPQHALVTAREQAHVVLAGYPRMRVGVLGSQHHRLTLSLAGSLLSDLGQRGAWTDPGVAVALLTRTLADSRSLVWHPRLFGLAEPQPRPAQTFLSVLPGRRYLTQLGGSDVQRLDGGLKISGDEVLYAGGAVPADLEQAFATTPAGVRRIPGFSTANAPNRTKGSVELTALRVPQPTPPAPGACRSCGAGLAIGWCLFCSQHPKGTDIGPVASALNGAAPRALL